MDKSRITLICENILKQALIENQQVSNTRINWVINGSVICNILPNVIKIDNVDVSEEFNRIAEEFVRQPKGDLDISYARDYHFKISFLSESVREYQEISKEKRTYNFIDHNNVFEEQETEQLCKMETKNGLVFFAKRPEYLFVFKLRELLALNFESVLNFDYDKIENKNLLKDVEILFCLACIYAGYDNVAGLIKEISDYSTILKKIKIEEPEKYNNIIIAITEYLELNNIEYTSGQLKKN